MAQTDLSLPGRTSVSVGLHLRWGYPLGAAFKSAVAHRDVTDQKYVEVTYPPPAVLARDL